jgi:hypothetical protein
MYLENQILLLMHLSRLPSLPSAPGCVAALLTSPSASLVVDLVQLVTAKKQFAYC